MEKNKKITIENLAEMIDTGFKASDKRTDAKIDNLASMVTRGFNDVQGQINQVKQDIGSMNKNIGSLAQRMGSLEYKVGSLMEDVDAFKVDVNSFKRGQEGIQAKLSDIVYQPAMDAVVDRVRILEGRVAVSRKK